MMSSANVVNRQNRPLGRMFAEAMVFLNQPAWGGGVEAGVGWTGAVGQWAGEVHTVCRSGNCTLQAALLGHCEAAKQSLRPHHSNHEQRDGHAEARAQKEA